MSELEVVETKLLELSARIEGIVADGEVADEEHKRAVAARRVLLRGMTVEKRDLEVEARRLSRPPRSGSNLRARIQAGPKNIGLMRDAAVELGRATQAGITRRANELAAERGLSPVGSGASSWAMRALEEDRVVRATGKRVAASREFVVVRKRERVTQLAPGE